MHRLAIMAIMAIMLSVSGAAAWTQGDSVSHRVTMRVVPASILELNDTSPIALSLYVPVDSDGASIGDTDSTKRLRYTVIADSARGKRIQVHMEGTPPDGTALRLEAVAMKPGIGNSVSGGLLLGSVARDLITRIPSCATGRGLSDGIALSYSLVEVDRSRLGVSTTSVATIVYTITEE